MTLSTKTVFTFKRNDFKANFKHKRVENVDIGTVGVVVTTVLNKLATSSNFIRGNFFSCIISARVRLFQAQFNLLGLREAVQVRKVVENTLKILGLYSQNLGS